MSSLDQSLSLKAQLRDEVSPALEKINRSAKTTQGALEELGNDAKKAGEVLGAAGEGMAGASRKATEKVQEDLKKTGGAFKELGQEAQQSSKQVGEALDSAFRSTKQARAVDELDEELKGLNSTLRGMAATNRPMAGRAKNVRAIGQDTINKKVIPAFQELHSTLDDLPDALSGVTGRMKEHSTLAEKMSSALTGVNERVSGMGDAVNKVKGHLLDFAGAITTSFFGIQGGKLREHQTTAGRQRGRGAFKGAESIVPLIQLTSRAPADVWGPAYETLLDTSKLALEEFPTMIDKMTELSKATGLATSTFAEMFVEMKEISNLSGEEWLDVTKKINFFASSSRASIEDIAQALAGSTEEMLGFSREARKAYAEHRMVAAAQAANAGVGAGFSGDLFSRVLESEEKQAKLKGLFAATGVNIDVDEALRKGDVAKISGGAAEASARYAQMYENQGANILEGNTRDAFNALWEGLVTPQEALRFSERKKELSATGESLLTEGERLQKEGKNIDFDALVGTIRGTGKEKFEQISSMVGASGMQIGKYTMDAIEAGMDPILALTTDMTTKLSLLPEMAKQGISFFSIGLNVMSALSGLLSSMGLGGLATAISGPLEKLLGAGIVTGGLTYGLKNREGAPAGTTMDDVYKSITQNGGTQQLTSLPPALKTGEEYLQQAREEIRQQIIDDQITFKDKEEKNAVIQEKALSLAQQDNEKVVAYNKQQELLASIDNLKRESEKSPLRRGLEGYVRGKVKSNLFMLEGMKDFFMPSQKEMALGASFGLTEAKKQKAALNTGLALADSGAIPGIPSEESRDLAISDMWRRSRETVSPGITTHEAVSPLIGAYLDSVKQAILNIETIKVKDENTTAKAVDNQTTILTRQEEVNLRMEKHLAAIASAVTNNAPSAASNTTTVPSSNTANKTSRAVNEYEG